METEQRSLVSNRVMEISVGAFIFALGVLLIYDAQRLGTGWADDGPKSGYFPFYIGLILCFCTVVAVIQGIRARNAAGTFVGRKQARLILAVLLPALVYVIAVRFLGIYVASALFIGAFMFWQGKFAWFKCVAVGVLVSICLFLMFEVWFTVPLPKGPLEALFGY
jgi:putative tricarboxylic transport membrane protein